MRHRGQHGQRRRLAGRGRPRESGRRCFEGPRARACQRAGCAGPDPLIGLHAVMLLCVSCTGVHALICCACLWACMYRLSCIPFVGVPAESDCLSSVCVLASIGRVPHVSNACNHGSSSGFPKGAGSHEIRFVLWVCFTLVQQPLGCECARRGRPGHPLCGRRLAHHAALPLPPTPAGATPRRPVCPPATFQSTCLAGAAERTGMPGCIERGSGD